MQSKRRRPSVFLAAMILAGLSSIGFISPVAAAPAPVRILPAQMALIRPKMLQTSRRDGAINVNRQWTFGLIVPSKNASGLFAYANAVANPNSSQYRQFLTHNQLMAQFGPPTSVMSSLTSYLKQQGLSVASDGQMIYVTGRVGQINRMFKTTLTSYQHGGQQYIAPSGEIAIPSPLRIAQGITGLVTNTLVPLNVGKPAKQLSLMKQESTHGKPPIGRFNGTFGGPLHVTAQLLSTGPRQPGMAVRYLITVTYHGMPDANAALTGLSGPFVGAGSGVDFTATNAAGQFVVDFTFSQAQQISMALTVAASAKPHAPTATVQLPIASFVGPSTQVATIASLFGSSAGSGSIVAPWNPSSNNIDQVFNANRLSQEPTVHGPANLAVFTAGNNVSVSTGDVNMFAQQFGLPTPNVSVAYQGPNVATTNLSGYEAELSLDLQMMETSSPGANVQVYEAGSLRSALNQVVTQDTAQVFSISYGEGELAEAAYSASAQSQWDTLAAEANIEGITITVSAGDSGAYEGAQEGSDIPQPSYPANSPYVSSLGGTEAAVSPTEQLIQSAMWGGNIGSELSPPTLLSFLSMENMIAGGGYSLLEPAPSYQQGLVPPGAGRGNPDFSFPASVVTPGYFAYFDGTPYFFGGTSASAPLFAGWVGDLDLAVGSSLGNVNPMIYGYAEKDPALLMPVAYGNNGVYSVTPGYNAATGLGELNMGQLLNDVSRDGQGHSLR